VIFGEMNEQRRLRVNKESVVDGEDSQKGDFSD
jgi:hypothetical protein